ncbi:MAG: hypothetical protein AAB414_03290 [Patescibacteria group bacterium]
MKRLIIVLIVTALLLGIILQKQLITHLKIILFITEEFPQIPIKPLNLVTLAPFHDKKGFETKNGKVVADLFIPVSPGPDSGVILAMGVKTSEKDKLILLHFAQTMARLGYITFWPRLEVLDKGESLPEEPGTFIEGFKYLEGLPQTDPERISFVGFSVGSSTAFVVSSNPQIADKVHSLVFFGGYYDIFDYILALYKQSLPLRGNQTSWKPHQDAINHAMTLLAAKGVATDSAVTSDSKDANRLKGYSPKEFVSDFKAKIFILHDKSDTYVPYTQSIKLYEAMPKDQVAAYHISDLFEHVQPNRPINIMELVKLYGFLYKVFYVL